MFVVLPLWPVQVLPMAESAQLNIESLDELLAALVEVVCSCFSRTCRVLLFVFGVPLASVVLVAPSTSIEHLSPILVELASSFWPINLPDVDCNDA